MAVSILERIALNDSIFIFRTDKREARFFNFFG